MTDLFFFNNIPRNAVGLVGPFILIIVGLVIEKKVAGKVVTFTNAVALNLAFYGKNLTSIGSMETPLVLYLDIGLIMGIAAIAAHVGKGQLPKEFQAVSWAYCSVVAGALTLLAVSVPYAI
jgi:hypothetical protein